MLFTNNHNKNRNKKSGQNQFKLLSNDNDQTDNTKKNLNFNCEKFNNQTNVRRVYLLRVQQKYTKPCSIH